MSKSQSVAGGSSQELPFLIFREIPPHTYEPLLSWLFDALEFQQWLLRGHSWQFRVIGQPGSGKTTLSSMTVDYLRQKFLGHNVVVLSIFFTPAISNDQYAVHHFLQSVLQQLISHQAEKQSSITGAIPPELAINYSEAATEELRKRIYSLAAHMKQIFLVIDDMDLCSQRTAVALEAELSALQKQKFSIMVTSRLSVWHKEWIDMCDIAPDHRGVPVEIFWCCATCYDQTSYENGDAEIICQACIESYHCPTCDSPPNFYEPYKYVDYNLIHIPPKVFQDFVAYEIELEHGDVGLGSLVENKPPLSKLGRVLVAAKAESSTSEAQRFRDKIIEDSGSNVTLAKLRLEAYRDAQSIDQLTRYGDRLPDNIVAVFDAAITAIEGKSELDRHIALKAISGAANKFEAQPFDLLERWIYHQIRHDSNLRIPTQHFSVEEVLRASSGLIDVSFGRDSGVTPFQPSFTLYVADSYNSSLFWTYTSMSNTDGRGFAKPKRAQTWQVKKRGSEPDEISLKGRKLGRIGSIRVPPPLHES